MKTTLSTVITAMFLITNSPADVHDVYPKNGKNSISNAKPKRVKMRRQLSDQQRTILKMAYDTAEKDGIENPEILSGIIMQESAAGAAPNFRSDKHKPGHDKTVGLGQIKASTARKVLERHPELKQQFVGIERKNIHHELATNDRFNVAVASKYLKDLSAIYSNEDRVIASYNMGPGGAKNLKSPSKFEYVKLVRLRIQQHNLSSL